MLSLKSYQNVIATDNFLGVMRAFISRLDFNYYIKHCCLAMATQCTELMSTATWTGISTIQAGMSNTFPQTPLQLQVEMPS